VGKNFRSGMLTKQRPLHAPCTIYWCMKQYIVPIVALFRGRVINKPAQAMMETRYSTGGEVEHEISPWFHVWGFYTLFCNRVGVLGQKS
jgi:hypothetical protein